MMMTQDPRALVYRKYALEYVRELMGEVLDPAEETTVLLHCGIHTGDPVTFSEIANLLQLYSAESAEELYDQAVRKTREAISGSRLETWLLGYRMADYPQRKDCICIDPDMPIPRWT